LDLSVITLVVAFICNDPTTGAVVACTTDQTSYWTSYNAGVATQCAAITVEDPVRDHGLLNMLKQQCMAQQQLTVPQ
jgi:hypothetical protein